MQVDTAVALLAFLYMAAHVFAQAAFAGSGLGPFLLPAAATLGAAALRTAQPARCGLKYLKFRVLDLSGLGPFLLLATSTTGAARRAAGTVRQCSAAPSTYVPAPERATTAMCSLISIQASTQYNSILRF